MSKIFYRPSKVGNSNEINKMIENNYPHMISETNPSIIMTSGGDGTFLHCIQEHLLEKKVFLGIGTGTVNFLMNPKENISQILSEIESGKKRLKIVKTFTLSVSVVRNNRTIFKGHAINDVTIGGLIRGYTRFNVKSEDRTVNREVRTTGILISTPLGSTAYNRNIGGLVIPNLDTPVISFNTIGAEYDKKICNLLNLQTITIKKDDEKAYTEVSLDCSEENRQELIKDDVVKISKGEILKLGFFDKKAFELNRLVKFS